MRPFRLKDGSECHLVPKFEVERSCSLKPSDISLSFPIPSVLNLTSSATLPNPGSRNHPRPPCTRCRRAPKPKRFFTVKPSELRILSALGAGAHANVYKASLAKPELCVSSRRESRCPQDIPRPCRIEAGRLGLLNLGGMYSMDLGLRVRFAGLRFSACGSGWGRFGGCVLSC